MFLGTARDEALTAVDSVSKMTVETGSLPEKIQFIPALCRHAFWIALGIVGVTFVFGRIYCSVICPLGIFQDFVAWIAKRVHRGKKTYLYKKPLPWLRWGVLVLSVGAFCLGFGALLCLVEPYSMYGRIVNGIFRPVYILFNNSVLVSDNASGSMAFSTLSFSSVFLSLGGFLVAISSFFVIGILAWRGGRTYCNTICPVGTFLGIFSRFAIFRVRLDSEKCKSCGMCAKKCKASCLDARGKKVDTSRCVDCFNCLGTCNFDALSYKAGNPFGKQKVIQIESAPKPEKPEDKTRARREFLITSASMAASVPVIAGVAATVSNTVMVQPEPDKVYKTGQHAWKRSNPVAPPGALSYEHLLQHCTACHLCVAKCPQHILKPSLVEYGLKGMFVPVMNFTSSFCNYDCTICSEVCPNGAIDILGMARKRNVEIPESKAERAELMRKEKNYAQIGRVVFVKENCVVPVDGTFCGACDEHCPTKAVSMVPYGDPEKGLTIPHIDQSICIGCGGCESICPARPHKAIYVEGCPTQEQRAEFKEAEVISADEIQEKTENMDDWLF